MLLSHGCCVVCSVFFLVFVGAIENLPSSSAKLWSYRILCYSLPSPFSCQFDGGVLGRRRRRQVTFTVGCCLTAQQSRTTKLKICLDAAASVCSMQSGGRVWAGGGVDWDNRL